MEVPRVRQWIPLGRPTPAQAVVIAGAVAVLVILGLACGSGPGPPPPLSSLEATLVGHKDGALGMAFSPDG